MIRILLYILTCLITILLAGPVLLTLLVKPQIDRWLTVNAPVEADVLILEGWTSPEITEQVVREFRNGSYKFLITTGGPLDKVYNMSSNGRIRFDLDAAGVDWSTGDTVSVSLFAYGEPAEGEYARYTIIRHGDTIGVGYTTGQMERFDYRFKVNEYPPDEISVIYDNDFYTDREDRNLHIWKIEVAEVSIPVRSEFTRLIRGSGPDAFDRPLEQKTLSREKAYRLTMAGIDSSRIVAVDVPHVRRLRTYTDAVMVNEWLRKNSEMPHAVNVFSQGKHARRSRLLYRYALPDSVQLGIIVPEAGNSIPQESSSAEGFTETLRELMAYIYTRTLFNSRWHYRRIVASVE